ncbi:hypothetical protein SAMN02799630_05432 [Paenibacillus sp. UNCCL117]|uniref:DUF6612 family protein n=1 Tax=unclassified Paenibacillus TaxID=185978 RepID=UPI000883FF5D|nr:MULTISPECIES: DUF6612 family protein [unclassified Paenibacillus]SDE46681.1 hypothetical protein SAMN04488602_12934 [Paenibacillus sp. cl123]SFW65812.1 hypothetical protein SAMN02799630_05432 [Paenibacillus sp. UNCCL117]
MKKWTVVMMLVPALAASLTACGSKASTDDTAPAASGSTSPAQSTPAASTPAAPAAQGVPTAEELIQKTSEASKSLKSYSMDSQVDQKITMTQNEQKQDQTVKTTMKTDIINEPLAMVQEITMNVSGMEGPQQIKQFITQDGIYMQTQGQWMKMPPEMKEQLMQAVQAQSNPQKQLEQFSSIVKDTKVTEEGEHYVLSAAVSGDSVKDLVKSIVAGQGTGGANPQIQAMVEQMKIQSMNLQYKVKKDGYLPVSMNVDMQMDMEQQGQKLSMDMKMDSMFSRYNEVKEIKVPQEALDAPSAGGAG